MQSGWAVGYILAALLSAAILPTYGWRPLFFVGAFPALLTLWMRREIPEPAIWLRTKQMDRQPIVSIFRPPLLRRTIFATLLAACLLFAYWGLFTWVPTYLASPVSKGGAGLGLVKSTGWIIPVQIGAFLGYTLFGVLADRFGRRPVLLLFVLGAAASVPLYGFAGGRPALLLVLGPLIGFFGHGYFSVFGAMLAELFPSLHPRHGPREFVITPGRAVSAVAPIAIGAISDRQGIGGALAFTSTFFLAGAGLIYFLPETNGGSLDS